MKSIESHRSSKSTNGNKEKLRTIMEAASALTSLGDSDSDASCSLKSNSTGSLERAVSPLEDAKPRRAKISDSAQKVVKRHIPSHKKPDAATTFPEKLMSMMRYAEKQEEKRKEYCIGWLPDGKSFVIRNPDAFTRKVLVKFFKATKFSSFTRKLYRWGFRQINRGLGPDDPIVFGNDYFQRDKEELIAKMRSTTAVGSRKIDAVESMEDHQYFGLQSRKRAIDSVLYLSGAEEQEQRKRILLENLVRQNTHLSDCEPLAGYSQGLASFDHSLNLANSLRVFPQNLSLTNPYAAPSFGFPGLYPKSGLGLMGNPSSLNMYHAVASQQSLPPPSSADIVNAAIDALRHSPS